MPDPKVRALREFCVCVCVCTRTLAPYPEQVPPARRQCTHTPRSSRPASPPFFYPSPLQADADDRPSTSVRFATPATAGATVASHAASTPVPVRRSTDGGAGLGGPPSAARPSVGGPPHSASRTDDAVLRARAREALAQLMEGHERFKQVSVGVGGGVGRRGDDTGRGG